MPLHRREKLLRLADTADLVIIKDYFESESSFDGNPIPALKSQDRSNRIIYIGSLSTFIQLSLSLFISLGYNDVQLKRLADAQKERGALVLEAMARHAPQCKVAPLSGGGSCWVQVAPQRPCCRIGAQGG